MSTAPRVRRKSWPRPRPLMMWLEGLIDILLESSDVFERARQRFRLS